MKKILLLGAFAALFIACDKNDMDEGIDVTQEPTIDNTIVVEDEVGFSDLEIANLIQESEQSDEASRGIPGGFNDWYAANGDIMIDNGTFGPPILGQKARMNGRNRWNNPELGAVRRWWSNRSSIWSNLSVKVTNGEKLLRFKTLPIPTNRRNYYNSRVRCEVTSKLLHRRDNIVGKGFRSHFVFIAPQKRTVNAAIFQNKLESYGGTEPEGGTESFVLLNGQNQLKVRFRPGQAYNGRRAVNGTFDAVGTINPGDRIAVFINQILDDGTLATPGYIRVLVFNMTTGEMLRNTKRVGKTIKHRRVYNRGSLRNGLYSRQIDKITTLDFVSISHEWFQPIVN